MKVQLRPLSHILFISLFTIFCLPKQGFAKHIIGGEMTSEVLSINADNTLITYGIRMTIYRDCYQGGGVGITPFDANGTIGIYTGSSEQWEYYNQLIVDVSPNTSQALPNKSGCSDLSRVCGDSNYYEFEIELPVIADSYLISYQRCCRQNAIINILNSGETGFALSYEITPLAQSEAVNGRPNTSPIFNDGPSVFYCSGEDIVYDQSAADIEGDSLVYSWYNVNTAGGDNTAIASSCDGTVPNPFLCTPPFAKVEYTTPEYGAFDPFAGKMVLDTLSGIIYGNVDITGGYVVGIEIKEYRDGELISISQRESIIQIRNCEGCNTTSLSDHAEQSLVSLSPNPANEILQITIEDDIDIRRIVILESTGRLVSDENRYSSEIDISKLNSGIYSLLIYTKDSVESHSFVKL